MWFSWLRCLKFGYHKFKFGAYQKGAFLTIHNYLNILTDNNIIIIICFTDITRMLSVGFFARHCTATRRTATAARIIVDCFIGHTDKKVLENCPEHAQGPTHDITCFFTDQIDKKRSRNANTHAKLTVLVHY